MNALLFANDPAVNFTNTIDAQTSTVTNGQTGSTYGLAGAGDMTITYAGVTGTSDTAKLSPAGRVHRPIVSLSTFLLQMLSKRRLSLQLVATLCRLPVVPGWLASL